MKENWRWVSEETLKNKLYPDLYIGVDDNGWYFVGKIENGRIISGEFDSFENLDEVVEFIEKSYLPYVYWEDLKGDFHVRVFESAEFAFQHFVICMSTGFPGISSVKISKIPELRRSIKSDSFRIVRK